MKKAFITTGLVIVAWLAIRSELCFGRCLNAQGDGKEYNGDPYYNYISYASTEAQEGDYVITYFLKNPANTECDDYIIRLDKVIRKGR